MPMFIETVLGRFCSFAFLGGSKFKPGIFVFQVRTGWSGVYRAKISEAGDPRYRLPLSQLDSPSERGASEGGSIKPVWEFSNDSCNELFQTTNIRLVPVRANS